MLSVVKIVKNEHNLSNLKNTTAPPVRVKILLRAVKLFRTELRKYRQSGNILCRSALANGHEVKIAPEVQNICRM
ncbi:MAG: hypothetical protein C0397_13440 [Odoribacter sp.]|nr:hypothetical protein [Odoribacter sp.]